MDGVVGLELGSGFRLGLGLGFGEEHEEHDLLFW